MTNDKKLNSKEEKTIELYKLYKEIFKPVQDCKKEESLEDKIEKVNPYYTRNNIINYVGN